MEYGIGYFLNEIGVPDKPIRRCDMATKKAEVQETVGELETRVVKEFVDGILQDVHGAIQTIPDRFSIIMKPVYAACKKHGINISQDVCVAGPIGEENTGLRIMFTLSVDRAVLERKYKAEAIKRHMALVNKE